MSNPPELAPKFVLIWGYFWCCHPKQQGKETDLKDMRLLAILVVFSEILTSIVFAKDQACKPSYPCCPSEEAEKAVIKAQQQFQALVQQNDYVGAGKMATPDAGFATLSNFCPTQCCLDVGDMTQWWNYYGPGDKIIYPVEPLGLQALKNGTFIYSVSEISGRSYGVTWAYRLNFYWVPVVGKYCMFKLSFISGNTYNCPSYISTPVDCLTCGITP